MAEDTEKQEGSGTSQQLGSSDVEPFLGEYKDVNSFAQKALGTLMQATKCSNSLPATGDDYEFYSSFDNIRDFYTDHGRKLLDNITDMMRHQGVRGNVREDSRTVEIDDKMDAIIDANDIILERVSTMLDEASGINKTAKPVLPPGAKDNIVVSSWNRKSHERSKSGTFRLMQAKNIQRPQMKFREKVDNSNMPFVPIIKYKPNAQKPLGRASIDKPEDLDVPAALADFIHQQRHEQETGDVIDMSGHPYQYELDHLQPIPSQLESRDPEKYKPLTDTQLKMINTLDQLQQLSDLLNKQKEFAVDLEHHSYRSFQGFTCLMQISTREEDYIVDTLELRSDLHILNEPFTNPNIVKVFHGADMDIGWLQRDFGLYVVNMFDTGQASRVLSFSQFSLAYLLNHFCQVQADKQFQLADWRIRPLPEELLRYAREDTHYLLYIYDVMKNELLEKGNAGKNLLRTVLSRSSQVCLKRYQKPLFNEESYFNLLRKNRKTFNSQQIHAFKLLFAWRDRIARTEDESCAYVLPNHMLFQISEVLPREPQGVLACCNPIPPLVRQQVNEIHQLVLLAREKPIQKTLQPETKKKEPVELKIKVKVINLESFLHCPHDLSHRSKSRSKSTSVSDIEMTDAAPISDRSSLFGHSSDDMRTPAVQMAEPIIDLFSYPNEDKPANEMTAAMKKVEKIKTQFVSPFEKYLPNKTVTQIASTLLEASKISLGDDKMRHSTEADVKPLVKTDLWKLKPATEPKKTQKPEELATSVEGNMKRQRDDVEENTATPIRQQMASMKKRKLVDTESRQKLDSDQSEKGEKTRDERPFHPFDYSKVNYKVFEEDKKKKKQKTYHPGSQIAGPSFQNAPRSRTAPSTGQRSMTYGNKAGSSHQRKQHWPKR
ncbi:exosome complex component 10-like [Glandiceps talaboti]